MSEHPPSAGDRNRLAAEQAPRVRPPAPAGRHGEQARPLNGSQRFLRPTARRGGRVCLYLALALLAAAACTCVERPPHGPMGSPIEMASDGPADNNFCYVCHINMKPEPLAVQHRKGGVGCMKCHGFSDAHSGDEDGVTPPQVMFAAEKVNRSCVKCHNGCGTLDFAALQTTLKASPKPYCTSCHGEHRLAIRTRRWDKTTGKLVYDDGVRMTSKSGMNNGGMQ